MTHPKPFHNPFAVLGAGRPRTTETPAPQAATPKAPAVGAKPVARAVVRIERSGRGGKEVTVVEHLALGATERERWLKALKTALGCGGVVEGDALVLQGDQRKRVPDLLRLRGVKKVTVAG